MVTTLKSAEGARAWHAWAVTGAQELREQKYDGVQWSGARGIELKGIGGGRA